MPPPEAGSYYYHCTEREVRGERVLLWYGKSQSIFTYLAGLVYYSLLSIMVLVPTTLLLITCLCILLQHSSCIMYYWLFCAVTIYVRYMVRTPITLFLCYLTAQQVAYLRHWELSVINGKILFCFATLDTLLSLLHLCYCQFIVSFRQSTLTHEGCILNER